MTSLAGLPSRSAWAINDSRWTISSAASTTRSMSACATKTTELRIGDDVVAGTDGDVADQDRLARGDFDDASARGAARDAAGEDGEVELAAFVDVARRALDDGAGHAAHLRPDGQVAAPAGGVEARALFADDDVAGRGGFDGGGAQVARGAAAFGPIELDREHAAGDASIGRDAGNARHGAGQPELVERVGDRARIHPKKPLSELIHKP